MPFILYPMNFLPLSPCGYMPSVPPRPRTSMSTGHRFTPLCRRGGGAKLPSTLKRNGGAVATP